MWETICDAWACWSGWKFGANSTEYPYSVIQNTPPTPPPPRKLKFRQILGLWIFSVTESPPLGTLSIFSYRIPPPLGLWVFSVTEYPPWDFEYFQLQNTPPGTLSIFSYRIPPLTNWCLGRSWYTDTHTHTQILCHLVCIVGEIILHSR